MNINLWIETIRELNEHGKTWDDVRFVCGDDFSITKPNFETIARDTNYDNGYGRQVIASDLKIVGDHWWLERHEYDGAEWWEYKEMPTYTEYKPIHNLCGGWSTVEECNMENCDE